MAHIMNICIFGASFLPRVGGMEYVMHNLATALHEQGHEVTVIAERLRWEPIGVEHHYKVVRYGPAIRGARKLGLDFISALVAVWRAHRQQPFDVLHSHGVSFAGRRAAVLKKWLGIPVIMTPHGMDIQRIPEINYGLRLDPKWARIIDKNLEAADAVTAISQSVARELTGIDQNKVFCVPNGIHIALYGKQDSRFLHDLLGLKDTANIILSVGRNHIKKGYALGIEAMDRLRADFGYDNFHYVIVGRGVKRLQGLVAEKGLNTFVSLVEEVPPDKVRNCYHSSQIFFSPSIVEGLSLVSIEAIACGLPLVATNVPGNEDIVRDNDCGLIVESRNPSDMARGLHQLLTKPDQRKSFADKALAGASNYDWNEVATQYTNVYTRVLEKKQ